MKYKVIICFKQIMPDGTREAYDGCEIYCSRDEIDDMIKNPDDFGYRNFFVRYHTKIENGKVMRWYTAVAETD